MKKEISHYRIRDINNIDKQMLFSNYIQHWP